MSEVNLENPFQKPVFPGAAESMGAFPAEGAPASVEYQAPVIPVAPEAAVNKPQRSAFGQEVKALAARFEDNHVPSVAELDELQAAGGQIKLGPSQAFGPGNKILPPQAKRVAELARQEWRLGSGRDQATEITGARHPNDLPEGVADRFRTSVRDSQREVDEKMQGFRDFKAETAARISLSDALESRDAARIAESERIATERANQARAEAEAARQGHQAKAAEARQQRLELLKSKQVEAARQQAYDEAYAATGSDAYGVAESVAEGAAARRRAELEQRGEEMLLPGNNRQDIPKSVIEDERRAQAEAAEAARRRAEELRDMKRDPSISGKDWYYMNPEERFAANKKAEADRARLVGDTDWFAEFMSPESATDSSDSSEFKVRPLEVEDDDELTSIASTYDAKHRVGDPKASAWLPPAAPGANSREQALPQTAAPENTDNSSPNDFDAFRQDFGPDASRTSSAPQPAAEDLDVPDFLKNTSRAPQPPRPIPQPVAANTADGPSEADQQEVNYQDAYAVYSKVAKNLTQARMQLVEAYARQDRSRGIPLLRRLGRNGNGVTRDFDQLQANFDMALNREIEARKRFERSAALPNAGGDGHTVEPFTRAEIIDAKVGAFEELMRGVVDEYTAHAANPAGNPRRKNEREPEPRLDRHQRLAGWFGRATRNHFSILTPEGSEHAEEVINRQVSDLRDQVNEQLWRIRTNPDPELTADRREAMADAYVNNLRTTGLLPEIGALERPGPTLGNRLGGLAARAATAVGLREPTGNAPVQPNQGSRGPRTT